MGEWIRMAANNFVTCEGVGCGYYAQRVTRLYPCRWKRCKRLMRQLKRDSGVASDGNIWVLWGAFDLDSRQRNADALHRWKSEKCERWVYLTLHAPGILLAHRVEGMPFPASYLLLGQVLVVDLSERKIERVVVPSRRGGCLIFPETAETEKEEFDCRRRRVHVLEECVG